MLFRSARHLHTRIGRLRQTKRSVGVCGRGGQHARATRLVQVVEVVRLEQNELAELRGHARAHARARCAFLPRSVLRRTCCCEREACSAVVGGRDGRTPRACGGERGPDERESSLLIGRALLVSKVGLRSHAPKQESAVPRGGFDRARAAKTALTRIYIMFVQAEIGRAHV